MISHPLFFLQSLLLTLIFITGARIVEGLTVDVGTEPNVSAMFYGGLQAVNGVEVDGPCS